MGIIRFAIVELIIRALGPVGGKILRAVLMFSRGA
jgi:hypothetical protein